MCAINIRTFERNDFNAVVLIMLILYLPHSHYEMMLFIHLFLIKAQVSHEKRFGCQRCRNFNTLRALLWNLYICLFLSLILALKFNIQSKIFDLFRQFSIVFIHFLTATLSLTQQECRAPPKADFRYGPALGIYNRTQK